MKKAQGTSKKKTEENKLIKQKKLQNIQNHSLPQPTTSAANIENSRKRKAPANAVGNRNTRRRLNENVPELSQIEITLSSLFSTTCHVESCSPLITGLTDSDLSRVSRKIEHSLPDSLKLEGLHSFKARLTVVTTIKKSPHDSDSLFVELFQNTHDEHKDEPISRKVIFKGLFTSCDSIKSLAKVFHHTTQPVQNLPVFIWHGGSVIGKKIKQYLQKALHCSILPFTFNTLHMQTFGIIWIKQNLSSEQTPNSYNLRIEYEHPITARTKKTQPDTVFIALIEFDNWLDRLEQLRSTPSLKDVLKIWSELSDKYSASIGTKFRSANYIKLASKDCVISKDGMIKIMRKSSMEDIKHTLSYLTTFIERMRS